MQMWALGIDALAMCGIAAADDLVDEGSVGDEVAKVPGASHQQGIADGVLEMAVRTFD